MIVMDRSQTSHGLDTVDYRIDQLCDAFEAAWQRDEQPDIARFIERADESHRGRLFYELLLVELEYRVGRSEQPSRDDYMREFPQFAELIEAAPFNDRSLARFGSAGQTIDGNLNSTLRNANPNQSALPPNELIGDFILIREIGRGGMGVVYEAQQISLRRRVALKVLSFGSSLSKQQIMRFHSEAYAAATLHHPNIVPVYSVGSDRGVYFYAMQLVNGRSIAELLAELRRRQVWLATGNTEKRSSGKTAKLSATSIVGSTDSTEFFRRVAEFGIQAAEALAYSHARGILHRDIKPANLLIDEEGKLWVTDFGLARAKDSSDLTKSGEVLGTLRYMSPEQLSGKQSGIDERTDVYSLGATLYESLSLTPAFGGNSEPEILRRIALEEPQRLRQINRCIPRDLETIVAKAMEKRVADRYSSARELADELRRYLASEPIKAKRASHAERIVKWSRRHHTLATTLGLAFVLLSAILLASIVMINRARIHALDALDTTSELLYASDMSAAFDAWDEGYSDEVQAILDRHRPAAGRPDRRGFEWDLLDRVARQPEPIVLAGHTGSVSEIGVFPDRRRLASVGDDGTLRIWDIGTQTSKMIPLSHEGLCSLAISPDGRHVAAGNTSIYLCDSEAAFAARELLRREYSVESMAFSPDGKKLAAGTRYDEVCLLSLEGKVIKSVPCSSRIESLEFTPKQPFLLMPNRRAVEYDSRHGIAQLWRDDLSAVVREFDSSDARRRANITMARSSPDGKWIAGGGLYQSRIRLFDSATGRVVAESQAARDLLTALAYSPDGKAIAVGYQNGVVECFEVKGRDSKPSLSERPRVLDAHQGRVDGLCFVDRNQLATSGKDGLIKIWNLQSVVRRQFNFSNESLRDVALSPDGTLLACAYVDEFMIANLSHEIVSRPGVRSPRSVAWSPASDRVAVCSDSFEVTIFDRRGNRLFDIRHPDLPEHVAFSADGRLVAVIGQTQLQICEASTGLELERRRLSTEEGGQSVAFSHNSQQLAYCDRSGAIFLRDLKSNLVTQTLMCESTPNAVAFSPDDSCIATGHADGVIRLWDVKNGQLVFRFVGHGRSVSEVAFVPDGRTLLSASSDGTVRVWSTAHNRILGTFHRIFATGIEPGRDIVCRLSISSDGRRLVVGYNKLNDRPKILLWDIDYSQR
jgi:WD40 repeat protein/serine/threonine protein kinase